MMYTNGKRHSPAQSEAGPSPGPPPACAMRSDVRTAKLTMATPVKKKTMALATNESASQKASNAGWADGGRSHVDVAAPWRPKTATATTPDRWKELAV